MDYMCLLGSLGDSSIVATPRGGRPELQLGRRDFFYFVHVVLLSIFTIFCLASFSVSLPYLSYFNLTVPIHKCSVEHSCMSSTFSIAAHTE